MVNTTDAIRRLLKAPQATTGEMESVLFKRFRAALRDATTDLKRQRIREKAANRFPGFEDLLASLGAVMVATAERQKVADRIIHMVRSEEAGASDFDALDSIDGRTVLTICARLDQEDIDKAKQKYSEIQSTNAKKPRKKRQDRASTIKIMCLARANGQTLDDFIEAASVGSFRGLTIKLEKAGGIDRFVVDADGEAEPRRVARSTLLDWWAAARSD